MQSPEAEVQVQGDAMRMRFIQSQSKHVHVQHMGCKVEPIICIREGARAMPTEEECVRGYTDCTTQLA